MFEKSITNSIIAYIRSIGGQAEKLKGDSSASGRPDINACINGRCFRIEVKTPDNRNQASKKQELNLARWYKAGAVAMAVYSKKAFEEFMHSIDLGTIGLIVYAEANKCISKCWIPKVNE